MATCLRCEYEWTPRVISPTECPNCKSRNWKGYTVVRLKRNFDPDIFKQMQEVGGGVSRNSVEEKAVRSENRGSGRAAQPQRKTESPAADVSEKEHNKLTYVPLDEL